MGWWERTRNGIDGLRRRFGGRSVTDEDEGTGAERQRPSRLTDAAVALLLAMADAAALAGVALLMFIVGMSHSGPPGRTTAASEDVSPLQLAVVWFVPCALAVSCYVHARLRMPITSVVQGLFCVIGTTLAIGETNMLLSFT
ncbi:hypothetical protein AQJ46_48905 [Streptomyces canus]|uniref:Uncharacterized protein n=1 Tax=Streptomyces canus TaxID=58343 RepID=A0A101RKA7_9ACTN|nr:MULTISPECIES: hypothetical protein [Streptomyces]KUN56028.1 hypothetical protein AQJ46_48905 [Streptomyces canus]MDI5905454.1 hypothetical protein [Streptomyces sp. 12257]